MKNIAKFIVGLGCSSVLLLAGCIDETKPTSVATEDQLSSSSKATEALLWAMPAFTNNYQTVSSSAYDWGYGSIMHIRDVMTADQVIVSSGYDWYSTWAENNYLGETYSRAQFIWNYFWKFVQTTNNMIGAINPEKANATQLGYLGMGYAFRAFAYLDMAQMYEFLPNDGTSAVNAAGNDVTNLTVPIVKNGITEDSARHNPRVSRAVMAEFIKSDLDAAAKYLDGVSRPSKVLPDLSCVYGLYARLYMWLGDYSNAKTYARKAIDLGEQTPTTKDEWLSTTKGFNDLSEASWMWGSSMSKEDEVVQSGILNWTAWMSNEAQYGYAAAGPFSMIDSKLYSQISNNDFRKLSFKAPKGSTLDGRMSYIDAAFGATLPDYASLKFRPGSGNVSDYNVGSADAYPLMRIEEMYFIEAEATAHLDAAAGAKLLNTFMKTYRYSSFNCKATTTDDVVAAIFQQKRIEFWGEGVIFFDYKRLNLPVDRAYTDAPNIWPASRRFQTTTRPAWMNFCIVQTEKNNNKALVGYENPDPSGKYALK